MKISTKQNAECIWAAPDQRVICLYIEDSWDREAVRKAFEVRNHRRVATLR